MKIEYEVKLEDPKMCDGCPFLDDTMCVCDCPDDSISEAFANLDMTPTADLPRPQECIDKHGE